METSILPTSTTISAPISLTGDIRVEAANPGVYTIIGRDHPEITPTIRYTCDKLTTDVGMKINAWVEFHSFIIPRNFRMYSYYHRRTSGEFSVLGDNFTFKNTLDIDNILHTVYDLDPSISLPKMSYLEAFEKFEQCPDSVRSAIRNFMLFYSMWNFPHIIPVETKRWQIAILISALEYLMERPQGCEGNCDVCGERPFHVEGKKSDELWESLIFSHIETNKQRKAYRNAVNTARNEIRNIVIHSGGQSDSISRGRGRKLKPHADLHGGVVTPYNVAAAADLHSIDDTALDTIVQHIALICRYVILNQFLELDIFPDLPEVELFQYTMTATSGNASVNVYVPEQKKLHLSKKSKSNDSKR